MYAIKHYDNPQCEGEKEFQDDLKRFKYIKRLLRKSVTQSYHSVKKCVWARSIYYTFTLQNSTRLLACTQVISYFPK